MRARWPGAADGAGGVFGGMAQQMFAPMSNGFSQQPQQPIQQPQAGRFTQKNSANPTQNSGGNTAEDPMEILAKLKKMLDAGLIEQNEYDAKKADILSRM